MMPVVLSINPEQRQEFDLFYHGKYIPAFLESIPEISLARRWAPLTNRADAKYITIYQLKTESVIEAIETSINNSMSKPEFRQFKEWKQNSFTSFERQFFDEKYTSSTSSSWLDNPFLLLNWAGTSSERLDTEFIPELLKKCPYLKSCRTYTQADSFNYHWTIFELANESSLYLLEKKIFQYKALNHWLNESVSEYSITKFQLIYSFPTHSD